LGLFKAEEFERLGRLIASGDGGTEMAMASSKGSATGHSTAPVARLLVVGLCVGFCQKGLGVTFQEVENLLLDIPVVLLPPAL
jgi:hypothetical protein